MIDHTDHEPSDAVVVRADGLSKRYGATSGSCRSPPKLQRHPANRRVARWALVERPVRAMVVVMLNVRLQDALLRACCVVQAPVGFPVTPATYARRVASSMKTSTYRRRSRTVSTVRKSHAMMPEACARRNAPQLSVARRGAGSMP
jgi:hypothetical protein